MRKKKKKGDRQITKEYAIKEKIKTEKRSFFGVGCIISKAPRIHT